jgi:proteasome lid subunit RPN8/RPN11
MVDDFVSKAINSDIEIVGLLIGTTEENCAFVRRLVIGENVLKSSVRFELDINTVAKTLETLANDEDIIGIIHSHPASPYPSLIDRNGMNYWPVIWVIINSITGDVKAWFFDREVKIVIEE